MAKLLEFQLQHQSFQWTLRTDLLRMDWFDLLAVQGILKSLLQHHSSKASVLRCSAFFTVQLSYPYMTTGKTIVLTRQTFVYKVMSLLFNMLSSLVIGFLPRSNCLLISWLQSSSAVILEPIKIKSDTVSQSISHMTDDGSKVQCCKEQHCVGNWNVRSMDQYKDVGYLCWLIYKWQDCQYGI